jgi:hypothetical protein
MLQEGCGGISMDNGTNVKSVIGQIISYFNQLLPPDRTSIWYMVVALAAGLMIGLFIFYIYKRTYSGAMYNRNFNISLLLTTMIMVLLIRLLKSYTLLSLGVIGAVSLVRFRTAVKETMDTVFVLWAVAEGITIGAGNNFLLIAAFGAVIIGVLIYVMSLGRGKLGLPYSLIIRHEFSSAGEVNQALHRLPRGARLKSKTVTRSGVEIIMQLNLPEENLGIVNNFLRIKGVLDAKLVKLQDEYEQGPV